MMLRLFYLTIIALVLGGIVHIVTVLLVPSYAQKDAWAHIATTGEPWKVVQVAAPGASDKNTLPGMDPLFGVAACRFDLSESAMMLEANGRLAFWSVALFDRRGRNSYSFNDRTAIGQQLFLIVVSPVQMAKLRRNPPEEVERAVLIESEIEQGFVLIRALQDDPARQAEVMQFLKSIRCDRYRVEEAAEADTATN